jgi:hypothetical protein
MATIPKLALIPSGYKAGKVYSVLPTSGIGDFDFTRASSATRVNSSGLIETVATGIPRLNYPLIDGVVNGCPSHLLEPTRLQKIQYSEDFSQSYWNKINTGYSTNSLISPNGTLTADKLIPTVGVSNKVIYINPFSESVLTYTCSIFAKKGEYEGLLLGTGANGTFFDLDNGTIRANYISAPIDSSIKNYGNGWFKCSITISTSSTNFYIGANDNISTSLSFNADGVGGVYVWGAQTEQGSFTTSYIPNYGTSAGITRVAETATGSGDANTFNDSEGVLMVEFALQDGDNETRQFSLSNGSDNENVKILQLNGSTIRFECKMSSGANFVQDVLISAENNNKFLIQYKANDYKVFVNGSSQNVSQRSTTPIGLNTINFDRGDGASDFYGNTKQIQYFDTALTDSELETLTSWTSFTEMANGQTYSIK